MLLRKLPANSFVSSIAHRAHDILVAGAAAEVALKAMADLIIARVGVLLQQVDSRHDHARRAVTAL